MDRKSQEQTKEAFGFKWKKRETYKSEAFRRKAYEWLLKRYFETEDKRTEFFLSKREQTFLDAGCGSGFTAGLLFGGFLNSVDYLGVDISKDAVDVARESFKESGIKGRFRVDNIQTMDLQKKFDIVYSEGVIHHASDPHAAFINLIDHLSDDGIFMFYVYRKKAPLREFADDMIRESLKPLSDNEAWNELLPLTKLGKVLGDLNIKIKIEEEVKLLGIPKGTYDIQRFFYWFFAKAYYDANFSVDEMNHINFDWFRPLNCFRFEPEEIRAWLKEANLEVLRFMIEESGITVVAKNV